MIGIVFVLRHGNADLDDPMIIRNMSRDLRLGGPAQTVGLIHTPVHVDDRSRWVHRDLVVAVKFGLQENLDGVPIPERGIFILLRGNSQGLPRLFFALNREVDRDDLIAEHTVPEVPAAADELTGARSEIDETPIALREFAGMI
ncbi:MAG: hypothetical protein ACI8UO_005713 [Verrucomicrobiales bacterium]|jgi:hypothetical protein